MAVIRSNVCEKVQYECDHVKPIPSRKQHQKRTKCDQCNKLYIGYETGSVRLIVDRLIDEKAIIKVTLCSLKCAAEYINKHEIKKR